MKIESSYLNGDYFERHPTWDRDDAPWKSGLVSKIIKDHDIQPYSICELGCGSGDIIRCLRIKFPGVKFFGYDISPQLVRFWADEDRLNPINFNLGDFHKINTMKYDVLLMLDVFEHVRDPLSFLEETRMHAKKFIFHIPLDLSAAAILRKSPLLNVRRGVGHLSYYTKDLALEILIEAGYKVIDWRYSGASYSMPNRLFRTKLARLPRKIAYAIDKDWGTRLLGGETLVVLAE